MLDSDLAQLYGVLTKVLNQAVQRNISRFPDDFMFQLTEKETDFLRSQIVTLNIQKENQEVTNLRSQIVTSSLGYGGRRYLPFAFTERNDEPTRSSEKTTHWV